MSDNYDNLTVGNKHQAISWLRTSAGLLFILGCLAMYFSISTPPEDESYLKFLYMIAGILQLTLAIKIRGQEGATSLGLIGVIYIMLAVAFILIGPGALFIAVKIFILFWVCLAIGLIGVLRMIVGSFYKGKDGWHSLSGCGLLTIVNLGVFMFLFYDNQLIRIMLSVELIINCIFLYLMAKVIRV